MSLSLRNFSLFLIVALIGALITATGYISNPKDSSADLRSATTPIDLTYYTEQLPPYNYQEKGTLQGISIDLLEAITEKMGKKVSRDEVLLVPWTEGYQTVLSHNNTVLFTTVRLPEREQSFRWAGPIYAYTNVLFARPDKGITIEKPEDMKDYRIGVIVDDVAIQQLLDAGVNKSQLVQETNASVLVDKLNNGEIDLWAYPEAAGRHFIEQATGNPYSLRIVFTLPVLEGYYAFNKNVSDSTVASFQQALDAVQKQKDSQGVSEYERIIYRNLGVGYTRQTFTDDEAVLLVNTTAAAIEKNAPDTFRRINTGEAPYQDPEEPALYTFVYDGNMTVVAHANNIWLVGLNFKGKTDVTGKQYRDEILAGALENGTGWMDYVYIHPVQTNLYYKTTYYRLT